MGAHYLISISLLTRMFVSHFHLLLYTVHILCPVFHWVICFFFQFICWSMFIPGIVNLCFMKFKYLLLHSHLSFDPIHDVFCYTEV